MERKLLFIYNPHAGKAQIRSNLLDIIDIFTKAGYTVTARPTQKRGDAEEAVINRSRDYELVVCSGGDGTLDEVVTGMMKCEDKTPIGYVPAGTTNDFARSLKISGNMQKAAADIVNGRDYACDAGIFNDDIQVYHIKAEHEGEVLEGDYMFGMITNSRSVGGFSKITGKNVDLNDGLFEVTLIKAPYNMAELNLIITSILGSRIHGDYMQTFKTSAITVESAEEIPWTLDGEFGGKHKAVSIKNAFQALHLIIPDRDKGIRQ